MRLLFYLDYDKFQRNEAPAILPFLQVIRDKGSELEFVTSEEKLLHGIEKGCDVVAISVFSSIELARALKAAIMVKKADPRIVTILGGQGVRGIAERLIHALGVDVVIEGEGEMMLPALLQCLETNELIREDGALVESFMEEELMLRKEEREYFGEKLQVFLEDHVLYRSPIPGEVGKKMVTACFKRESSERGGRLSFLVPVRGVYVKTYEGDVLRASPDYKEVYNTGLVEKGEVDYPSSFREYLRLSTPYPTEEELNSFSNYPWDIFDEGGWKALSIYAQRGCNWSKCSYCGISTPYGRRLAPSTVIKWLKEARDRGVSLVTFEDDQFLQNRRWVEELCDLIVKEGLSEDFQFGAMIRVDAVRQMETLKKLKEAGFSKLQIGVESLIPEKIRYFRKTVQGKEEEYIKKAHKLVEHCLSLGIQPGVFIITTRPKKNEALVEVAEELKRASEILVDSYKKFSCLPTLSFNDILMAYPGAPLLDYEEYKKVLIPLGPERTSDGLAFSSLAIPYIFELKSIALANFIGILREMSRRRGIPPEMANETLEHIEDLVNALEVSAQHLVTEIGVALRVVESMDIGEEKKRQMMKMIITGRIQPEEMLRGEDLPESRVKAEEEKQRILELCVQIRSNLISVEEPMTQEVNAHLINVRKKLKMLETARITTMEFNHSLEEIRRETKELYNRMYPLYRARRTLESLLKFIDEFEKARG